MNKQTHPWCQLETDNSWLILEEVNAVSFHNTESVSRAEDARRYALKGQLDGEEFVRLLKLIDGLDPRAAADLRRRSLAGARRYATSRKRI